VPLREKEGLTLTESAQIDSSLFKVEENDFLYYVDLNNGQKTGWFYDQRANRAWLADRVKQKTVLDLYSYCGGFGLLAAKRGALKVTLVDSSQKALDLAQLAAQNANLSCDFIKADIFSLLPTLQEKGQTFDVVAVDPPAFVKQQKYQAQGLKGYQKLAKMVAPLVTKGGLLMITSCSHHASSFEFRQAVEQGMQKANRNFKLMRKSGADSDHPIHPLLPETHYLKNLSYLVE
jgi:23S rRNA (cytosine1962-C5)-methyltransferase